MTISRIDSKTKSGSYRVAVLKASLVTVAASAACLFPLLTPFTAASVQQN